MGLINEFQTIYYLIDSKEIEFIISLANNDINSISTKDYFKDYVLRKLFRHTSLQNANCNYFYLKNKYLYLFTEGAINFIEANNSMEGKKDLAEVEIISLRDAISSINDDTINIVSFGSGTSESELKAISSFKDKKINYYALDVSLYLLEIGIINYSKNLTINNNITFNSIIADFWDAAKSPNIVALNKIINREFKTIFTFFGGTIGNYPERELISQFLKIMNEHDYFIIGYDVWTSNRPTNINKLKVKDLLFNKYNTIGNLQFLIQPLKYIPKYSGYINHFSKYFSFSKEDSVLIDKTNENEFDKITNVKHSIVYAPFLKIPDLDSNEIKIRLAQSTKYFTRNFSDEHNNLTLFLNTICQDYKKLKTQKTYGKLEDNGILGCCVSKFCVVKKQNCENETCKAKTVI